MNFIISALPMAAFAPLFALAEADLAARGMRRVVAHGPAGYPCRVSLVDAFEGEELLLLQYAHHVVATPYRGSGPIYVRKEADQAQPGNGKVPELLRSRMLSLRAYDRGGMMLDAEVAPGVQVEPTMQRLLGIHGADYIYIHFAKPGCYACRVDRA